MSKKVVLLVEDKKSIQELWNFMIEGFLEELNGNRPNLSIVNAFSINEATQQFFAHLPDIAAVAMDGRVDKSDELDTEPLVRMMRSVFSGPIFAVAADRNDRFSLRDAGCDYMCNDKADFPIMLMKLFVA